MELKEAFADALAKLQANEAEAQRLAKERPLLVAEVEGLKLALQRHGGAVEQPKAEELSTPTHRLADLPNRPLVELSRPAAIKKILSGASRPMSPTELLEQLRETGRDNDHAHVVSAALSNLQAKGQVERVARGQWALTRLENGQGGVGVLTPLRLEESEGRPDN